MKTAILLCSMGGPDSPKAVRPFLFNLFRDHAILRLPNPLRWGMALLISSLRAAPARAIYAKIGGASPIAKNTRDQAEALDKLLSTQGEYRCFVGMSYWHPFIAAALAQIKAYAPDHLIVVPLYPQYSTTTTQSVFDAVNQGMKRQRIKIPVSRINSFQADKGFIAAQCQNLKPVFREAEKFGRPRVLFSAHGLPERIVQAGDPYPAQCKETMGALLVALEQPDIDHVLCYQSKVGRLAWIGPSTADETRRAALEHRPIVVVPMAFVSEHSETLVELDIDLRREAEDLGCPYFGVVPTVGTNPAFIQGLAERVLEINQKCAET